MASITGSENEYSTGTATEEFNIQLTTTAMVTETTVIPENENSVSGITGQHTTQHTAAESSSTITTFAASTSSDIAPIGETTPATSIGTTTNVTATDTKQAEIATTENENSSE